MIDFNHFKFAEMKEIIRLFNVWIKNVVHTETDRAFRVPASQSGMIEKSIGDCRRRIAHLEKKFDASELDADWEQYLHTGGQALKEQKKRLGVRLQDLALLLEIHPTTISHWIQGRSVLSQRSCQKIARLCNMGKTEALRKIALCKALRKEREAEE